MFYFALPCLLFVAFSCLEPREVAALLLHRISHAGPRFTPRICSFPSSRESLLGRVGAAGYQKQQGSCLRAAVTALFCRALAGCIIKRAGTELNLCKAHRVGGSCKLFSNRSQAAGITPPAAAASEKGEPTGRRRRAETRSERALPADGHPRRGPAAAAAPAPAPGAAASAPGTRSVSGRML